MDSVSEQIHDWYTQWNRIEQAYSRWAAENGLTDAMLSCLIFLQRTEQACTQQKICTELSLPKQTVSAALLSLEKKKLDYTSGGGIGSQDPHCAFHTRGKNTDGSSAERPASDGAACVFEPDGRRTREVYPYRLTSCKASDAAA